MQQEILDSEKEPENPLYEDVAGDISWKITNDGTLFVSGKGDYHQVSTDGKTKFYPAPWLVYSQSIKKAFISLSEITSMNGMFINCSNLTEVYFENTDFSQVTDMTSMFENCSSLTAIPRQIDTSKAESLKNMFYGCKSLVSEYALPFQM